MPSATFETPPDQNQELYSDLLQLARATVGANGYQVTPLLRRLIKRYRVTHPDLAILLTNLLRESPLRSTGVPATALSEPVDSESRLQLIREEDPVILELDPILPEEILGALDQIAEEHLNPNRLLGAGLTPTRTTLFVGPPGVGKTLAARWLASRLDRPLIILDLASVMSSLLGRTGENVRRVLEYAKQTRCVLLLDELDAVAKRRDDVTEIGELKRLVTVLLQEIDMWPEGSLLLAATNHADLLDPAVWRRFEVVLKFPLPDESSLAKAMLEFLNGEEVSPRLVETLAPLYRGASYSDLQRAVMRARRTAAMQESSVEESLMSVTRDHLRDLPKSHQVRLANDLMKRTGFSQRRVHEITGVSRDTLRRHSPGNPELDTQRSAHA